MVYTSVCQKLLNQHYGENSLCITLWPDVGLNSQPTPNLRKKLPSDWAQTKQTSAEISPDIITCTFFTCTCRFNTCIPFEYFLLIT